MTEAEGLAFFNEFGYFPVKVAPPRPASTRPVVPTAGDNRPRHLALRGWRTPLHWTVPSLFENGKRAKAIELLGYEGFMDAVAAYWEAVGSLGVQRAQREHERWAVRACLRTFETHARGLQRQAQSSRGGSWSLDDRGRVNVRVSEQKLVDSGRLMVDLRYYLKCYHVPESSWAAVERLVRLQLTKKYSVDAGVKADPVLEAPYTVPQKMVYAPEILEGLV